MAAAPVASSALQRPPRLRRLEATLARSRHVALPAAGWRRWVRERVGASAATPAAIVAAAWGMPVDPARHYWLATPVHLFAGLDNVRLHPQGLLRLRADEQQRLVHEFAAVFHDSPWRLIARDRRELLLAGPALRASGADPATLLGADPSAGLPQGADAAALRRLSSEIELWLHEHPVNLERLRRSELPVTALWLWGDVPAAAAADAASPRERAPLPQLIGEDTYTEALWQLSRADQPALVGPSRADTSSATLEPAAALAAPGGVVLLQRVCEAPGLVSVLEQLERRWLPAAHSALRARRLSALHLVTGERVHSLSWWGLAQLWRSSRPWWETL